MVTSDRIMMGLPLRRTLVRLVILLGIVRCVCRLGLWLKVVVFFYHIGT